MCQSSYSVHKEQLLRQLERSNPGCDVGVGYDWGSRHWNCRVTLPDEREIKMEFGDWYDFPDGTIDSLENADEPWTPMRKVYEWFVTANNNLTAPLWAEVDNYYEGSTYDGWVCYINQGNPEDDTFEVMGALICPINAKSLSDVKVDIW